MVTSVEERWQTRIRSTSEGIRHIFRSKEFSDVTFLVRGQPIKAHKLVLASRSLELARLLMSPNASDEFVVPAPLTPRGFQSFLSFMYTNELDAGDRRAVVEAYHCAKHYDQRALQQRCLEEVESWEIDAEDACALLGMEPGVPGLRERCISFVRSHAGRVISSEAFAGASDATMVAILDSGALADVPVLQRIERVMNWGKRHLSATDEDYSRVRQRLLRATEPGAKPLLGRLGIENLDVQDFPDLVVNYPKLLTDEEIRRFMVHSRSGKSSDLPPWCSESVGGSSEAVEEK